MAKEKYVVLYDLDQDDWASAYGKLIGKNGDFFEVKTLYSASGKEPPAWPKKNCKVFPSLEAARLAYEKG